MKHKTRSLELNKKVTAKQEAEAHRLRSLYKDEEVIESDTEHLFRPTYTNNASLYLNDEEKEELQKNSSPMHNLPCKDAPKYLNIESPLRPISTYMIAEYI